MTDEELGTNIKALFERLLAVSQEALDAGLEVDAGISIHDDKACGYLDVRRRVLNYESKKSEKAGG